MGFKLDGYVEVKDRIPEFWEKYPEGRIISQPPVVVEIGGRTFVGVTSAVFADRSDSMPISQASSWEPFPGQSNFTKDSEAENAETSAIGRALGALGIGIKHGFASADEVRNRQSAEDAEPAVTSAEASRQLDAALKDSGAWFSGMEAQQLAEHAAEVWGDVSPRVVGHGRIPQSEVDRLLAAARKHANEVIRNEAEAPNR